MGKILAFIPIHPELQTSSPPSVEIPSGSSKEKTNWGYTTRFMFIQKQNPGMPDKLVGSVEFVDGTMVPLFKSGQLDRKSVV